MREIIGAAHDGGPGARPGSDPLAAACVTVAWLIVANKPIYPLYVWGLVGSGVAAAWLTALTAPLFLAVAVVGRRHGLAARVGLPLVGAADTLFATKLMGPASGTELFLVPCLLLACLSFRVAEAWWARGLVAVLFVTFVAAHDRLGPPLHLWSSDDLDRLRDLNLYAVASLSAFIGWRFATLERS